MQWSTGCDDTCPDCGALDISPAEIVDKSVVIRILWCGGFVIKYSPFHAEHDPCYTIFGKIRNTDELPETLEKAFGKSVLG